MLAAETGHRIAHFGLLEDSQDLPVAELKSLHTKLPPGEKIPLLRLAVDWVNHPTPF